MTTSPTPRALELASLRRQLADCPWLAMTGRCLACSAIRDRLRLLGEAVDGPVVGCGGGSERRVVSTSLPEQARAALAVVREFHRIEGEPPAVAAALATLQLAIEEAVTMRDAFFELVEDELAIMRPVTSAATVWFYAPDGGIDRLAADMGLVLALEEGGFIPKYEPEVGAGELTYRSSPEIPDSSDRVTRNRLSAARSSGLVGAGGKR